MVGETYSHLLKSITINNVNLFSSLRPRARLSTSAKAESLHKHNLI